MRPVTVAGAGLAGSECAWQLARRGIPVRLVEMKPGKYSPAHVSPDFAELVCSNSLRSDELTNAVGLLKEEMRRLGSLVMESADKNRVADGQVVVRVDDLRKTVVNHLAVFFLHFCLPTQKFRFVTSFRTHFNAVFRVS